MIPQARDEGTEGVRGGRRQTDQRSTVPMSAWDALMGEGRVIEAPDASTTWRPEPVGVGVG